MNQRQVNSAIARELDKFQVILEYGRVFLDEDKALRSKYRWLIWIKKHIAWGVLISIIEVAVSFLNQEKWIWIAFVGTIVLIFIGCITIYCYRKDIGLLISQEDRDKEETLLKELNTYLNKLSSWLIRVDCNTKVSQKDLNTVWYEFDKEKALISSCEDDLSLLHGKLRPELTKKANELAIERLEQFNKFVYE